MKKAIFAAVAAATLMGTIAHAGELGFSQSERDYYARATEHLHFVYSDLTSDQALIDRISFAGNTPTGKPDLFRYEYDAGLRCGFSLGFDTGSCDYKRDADHFHAQWADHRTYRY